MTAWIAASPSRSARVLLCAAMLAIAGRGFNDAMAEEAPTTEKQLAQLTPFGSPVMPSSVSEPGAPPPIIHTLGAPNQTSSPVQPGLPIMQPTPPSHVNAIPPIQAPISPQPGFTPATPAEIAPLPSDEPSVTLFENQPPSASSGPWGDLLTGSVVKIQSIPIDLPTVLKLVESQNLPIIRDRLTAKIDNLTYYRVLSDLLPDIQGSYVQSRFQGSILVFGNSTVPTFQTRLVPQLTASWTVRPGGEDVFLALAAKQRANGAKAAVLDTLNTQLSTAASQYYDLLSANAQVENSRLSIQETQSQVKLNQARLAAGVGTKLDLETARNQLVLREQILIDAENTYARTQQGLLNILNLSPDVELVPAKTPVQSRPLVPFDLTTDQLVARAIANNPSLKISEYELRALRDEAKIPLSRLVPSVTLQTYIGGLGAHWNQMGLTRFGGMTVQANLFENLGTAIPIDYANRRLAIKRQAIIKAQQIRDLQTLVINAFLDSRSSAKALMAAQEQLAVAQETYRLAYGRFRAGLGINLDLLNAQTSLSLARTTVVRAILSFDQAQVRLLNALGDATTPHLLNGIPSTLFTKPGSAKP